MDLIDIVQAGSSAIGIVIVILLGLIKIPKKEINIWGWLGKQLTGGIDKRLETIDKKFKSEEDKYDELLATFNKNLSDLNGKLDAHIDANMKHHMLSTRKAILDFADELLNYQYKSKEHFEDVLTAIDEYEKYCIDHPEFPNNRCLIAIQFIKDEYQDRIKNSKFKK